MRQLHMMSLRKQRLPRLTPSAPPLKGDPVGGPALPDGGVQLRREGDGREGSQDLRNHPQEVLQPQRAAGRHA